MRPILAAAAALLLAATDPSAPRAAEALIPVDEFTRYDEFGTIKISPDGEFLALSAGKLGRSLIVFISLEEMKAITGVRAVDPGEIFDFEWISPTRLIYHLGERYAGNSFPTPTGEIGAIDRNGKRHEFIYGYRAGQKSVGTRLQVRQASYATPTVVSPLRREEKFILITEQPWREGAGAWYDNPDAAPLIARLNVFTGDKRRMGAAPLAAAIVLVDGNDEVRFAIGYDRQAKLAASWKPDPRAEWQTFELPGFRAETVIPRRLSADGSGVLFTGVRTGESLYALYRLDLATRTVEKLYGHLEADIERIVTDATGTEIVGVRVYAAKPEYHWILPDHPVAKAYRALQPAFPGQVVEITSMTDDARLGVVFVHSDVNPGEYYLFDTGTKRADFLRAARQWVDPRQMLPKEPIRLAARDGLPLHGYLTRPRGAGPHALVVMPHGGPHGVRDGWESDSEVQLLASRGYAVLQVNFRGSDGYGVDFQTAGYREWGGKIQDDITDATRWAIEGGIADEERICIVGASFGGYSALMSAAREPALYRCAVGFAGVYDLELLYSSGDLPRSRLGRSYLVEAVGNDRELLRAHSPVHHAERIAAPVLLIHGREDWRADFQQAKRMRAALDQAGKRYEWVALKGEGHGIYSDEVRKETYERILAFLAEHLRRH